MNRHALILRRNFSSSPVSLFQRSQTLLKFRHLWEKVDEAFSMCVSEFSPPWRNEVHDSSQDPYRTLSTEFLYVCLCWYRHYCNNMTHNWWLSPKCSVTNDLSFQWVPYFITDPYLSLYWIYFKVSITEHIIEKI